MSGDAVDAVEAADWATEKIMPVAGGYRDQTQLWGECVKFVRGVEAECKAAAWEK